MPKPILIDDRAILLKGLSVPGQSDDENDRIGAILVDGVDISYSVTKGPGLNPLQVVDLLVAIEAISSRYSTPWVLPAAVHMEKRKTGHAAEITEADGGQISKSLLFAREQIGCVADFVLGDDEDRTICILVGNDDELHYEFHSLAIELANKYPRPP